jgi:hypothetical protein
MVHTKLGETGQAKTNIVVLTSRQRMLLAMSHKIGQPYAHVVV